MDYNNPLEKILIINICLPRNHLQLQNVKQNDTFESYSSPEIHLYILLTFNVFSSPILNTDDFDPLQN